MGSDDISALFERTLGILDRLRRLSGELKLRDPSPVDIFTLTSTAIPSLMDGRIKSLREQVAAAQFLLTSLQSQLTKAENEAAAQAIQVSQQQIDLDDIGRPPGTDQGVANVEAGESLDGLAGYSATVLETQPNITDGNDLAFLVSNDKDNAPQEAVIDTTSGFPLPSLEVGCIYPSLEHVKAAARAYAISQGWTCGVYKRDKTRILLKCRSDDSCPFFVRAEQYESGARIVSYRPKHSCTFQTDQSHVARAHATSFQYMREQLPTFLDVDASTTAKEIGDAIFQRFGTRVSVKQCQKLRVGPKRKRKQSTGTCGRCGVVGHNVKTCGRITE